MSFDNRMSRIELAEGEILKRASKIMRSGGNVYVADLFVLGASKRLIAVSSGFRSLMSVRNFTCAAALLRMQIDTVARLNAFRLVDNPNELCDAVISGKRFDKQKDRHGRFLKDSYLIQSLDAEFPWVSSVYKETSGFIHLSERHVFATMFNADDQTRSISIQISAEDPERPDDHYFEILDAFHETLGIACSFVTGYVEHRNASDTQQA